MTTAADRLLARLQKAPSGFWQVLSKDDLKAAAVLYARGLVQTVHLSLDHWEIRLREIAK